MSEGNRMSEDLTVCAHLARALLARGHARRTAPDSFGARMQAEMVRRIASYVAGQTGLALREDSTAQRLLFEGSQALCSLAPDLHVRVCVLPSLAFGMSIGCTSKYPVRQSLRHAANAAKEGFVQLAWEALDAVPSADLVSKWSFAARDVAAEGK